MQDQQVGKPGLRGLRESRGLSLEAVAYMGGVDPATVSRIERNLVQPERETVVKLARALKMSVSRMCSLLEDGRAGRSGSMPLEIETTEEPG